MKFGPSDFSVFLVDGYNLSAALIENGSILREHLTQQTNPFGVNSEEHTPISITKGALSLGGGLYDPTTDALHTQLATVVGILRQISALYAGNVAGRIFTAMSGAYSQKYDVMGKRDGLTAANVTYLVSGDVEDGEIVQKLSTFTADWDTKTGGANSPDEPVDHTLFTANRTIPIITNSVANPTVISTGTVAHGLSTGDIIFITGSNSTPSINGQRTVTVISPTTFSVPVNVTVGGSAGYFVRANTVATSAQPAHGYLHVTAYSGFTNVVMKIMHSPDDVTYAALITFATVTAIGKQRVAYTGTIDRYLSSNGDVTGAGSITVFSGLVR